MPILMLLSSLLFLAASQPGFGQAQETPSSLPSWLTRLKPMDGEFRVRPGHPRLYLVPEDLPIIRKRISATHAVEWESIERARESRSLTDRMLANAFSYQLESDPAYARKAIEAALELAAMDQKSNDDLKLAYRVWPESVVFDWCYDQFRPRERDNLLGLVRGQLEIAGGRVLEQQPPHAGHLVNYLADAWIPAGIAFYDQDPAIFNRALAVVRTQIAAKDIFYRYGASSQGNSYGVTHVNGDFRLLTLLLKATGVDLFARFPFYRELGYYWIYTRRPDGQFLRNGDDWLDDMRQNNRINRSEGNPAIDLWTHPWLAEFLLYGAAQYSDPYLLGEYLKVRDLDRSWTAIEDIIWRDPGLVPKGPESLPPIRYLGGSVGTLLFRTGWGMDDVVGMFKVMPLFAKNHDHLDRLSFQIYCRGALALDSGLYEGSNSLYDSDHWLNYLQRTIAHNTLLIRDPDEHLTYRGKAVNVDGGQFYPQEGANADTLEAIADPQWRTAKVLAAETDPAFRYAFVAGDATAGYGRKAELVQRTFVFLNPAHADASAFIVIADRVVSRSAGYEKVFLLHSMEEPGIEDGIITIHRTTGRNHGGTLVSQTIEPHHAVIEAVGGPGKEFSVNGVNYCTEKGGDAEGGAWRAEVTTSAARKSVDFLHAIQVFAGEPAAFHPALAVEGEGVSGAEFPGWTVVVAKPGRRAGQPITYTSRAAGKQLQLLIGLPADQGVRIALGGKELARRKTSPNGSLMFETNQATGTAVEVTVRLQDRMN
jgi:hypothetical protein